MNNKTGTDKISTNQDLPSQVKKWVEEQGYSLEMRVAKKFQENGFDVSQFDHFVDQESRSVRPVDVVASLSRDIGNSRIVVKLFVECKYSAKDKPWVIIVTSDKFDKFSFFSRILRGRHPSNWLDIESLQGRIVAKIIQAIDSNSDLDLFSIKNPGYVVAESFASQKDHAYEAIVQIGKSVEAHDIEIEETYKQTTQIFDHSNDLNISSELGLFFSIAIPIVVINGQLFESYLGINNEIEASEIQNGTVLVPYRHREINLHSQVILSPVTVVTEKYLDNYISLIKQGIESILSQTEAIKDVIEFEKSKFIKPTDEVDF
ncbi:MAG: hypothetical protein HZB18_14890 [Chloroflexi bacterium]|nr:hypothetical protein [Chloroflexota bacterium]